MILRRPLLSKKGPMNAASPAYHAQGNYNSAKRTYQPRGVNAIPLGIRRKTSPICTPPGNSSNTLDSSLGTPNNYSPPNSPQIGDISSDCFPQGGGDGSQYGQGSPYQGSGFRGSHHRGSGRSKGLLKVYYHKSMVQDPWKVLKPVIWKPHRDTRDSPNSWLPKSNSSKKAKLGETPTESTPQQSVAEYLAAAFTEAASKDTVNDESGT
uniref:Uncharacterized protein isoform X2 n=1 Tax=Nicotiana tabacum TaxID=4097 RepID=A0A1S4B331_TOBAC|nr:PREDICTED: uncharacterized protein LOC107803959 isoform X2 [Nicotiana tabacum]